MTLFGLLMLPGVHYAECSSPMHSCSGICISYFYLDNLFLDNPLLQLKFWILRNYPWVNSGDIQKSSGQLWKAPEDWVI